MDLFGIITTALLLGLVPKFLEAVLWLIVRLTTHVVVINELTQVSNMDRLLAGIGWCSPSRLVGPTCLPADGAHLLFMRGPAIAIRETSIQGRGDVTRKYTIYATGSASRAIQANLTGDPRDVTCRYVYAPAPWRTSTVTVQCTPPPSSYKWQKRAVNLLLSRYKSANYVTALVSGGAGVGKSTLGELLSVAIKTSLNVAPEVVKNMDLTAKGLLLEDAFDTPTQLTPVILMLDEFNATIDAAEKCDKPNQREGASLAETPTSLLTLLDRVGRTRHLIVIATTNTPLEQMQEGIYQRYTRKGRLDYHIQIDAKKNIVVTYG